MGGFMIEPWVVDLVLAAFVLEGALLVGWRAATGRGIGYGAVAANLLSGGLIVMALRVAMVGGRTEAVAACLLGSLVAHLADLRQRWN